MHEFADFQRDLAQALRDPDHSPAGLNLAGLSVYRNTVAKGLIDVLRANFPTVERIVGEEWFAACASVFIRANAPKSPVLATYGDAFPGFLRSFEPAAEISYLADIAQVDALWSEAHFAADGPSLDPIGLQALALDRLLEFSLPLHTSARIAWFPSPIATLWRLNRPPAATPTAGDFQIDWRPEGIALSRPHGAVVATTLSAWQFAFLEACREGLTFGDAMSAGMDGADDFNPDSLGALFAAGLFAAVEPPCSTSTDEHSPFIPSGRQTQ